MPYRDERHALESRLETLQKELADVRARARELADVRGREARLAAEIEATRRTLADLGGAKKRLATLDGLRIASPCSARWEEMVGDDRVRFCGSCAKDVFNLSAMTRAEAEALLAERAGSGLCVRMYQRRDGTVITADCPVGVRRKRVRRVAAVAIAGAGVAAAVSTLATSTARMGAPCPIAPARVTASSERTGEIAPPPTPITGTIPPMPR